MDAMTETPPLLLTRDARGAVRLTLNRPDALNALSEALLDALQDTIGAIGADEAARLVIIEGAGRAFCAGHDLREMMALPDPAAQRALFAKCSRVMLSLQHLPVPVIARVHGIATAAGCQLVATCDLAIAAESARFAVSGVNLGLFCATPSVALARNVPRKAVLEMLFTGGMIGAREAERRFLINRAVPDGELDDAVEHLVTNILAKPRAALAIGKAQFYRQTEQGVEAAYATASEAMACNLAEPSARQGIGAFIGRNKPR
ncbi:enoyl-CoA hydratase [Acidiphilium iwatense]|nr:enoyl-CoA hydratase [Acidiphilium iwatense]